MANKPRYTKAQVAKALAMAGGIPYRAAKRLKCDWHTVRDYIRRYPDLQQVIDDAREEWLDESEDQLRSAVKRGEGWAVKFHLSTQGKDRGYVEQKQLTGANGAPLRGSASVVVVQVPDNGRDQPRLEGRPSTVIDVPARVIEDKSNG